MCLKRHRIGAFDSVAMQQGLLRFNQTNDGMKISLDATLFGVFRLCILISTTLPTLCRILESSSPPTFRERVQEKINRVRSVAGSAFFALLHSNANSNEGAMMLVPHVPHRAELEAIFPRYE